MRNWIVEAWQFLKKLYSFYLPIRFSFLALAVLLFAFCFSDQGGDILRALAEDPSPRTWVGRLATFIVATDLLAFGIWYWSRHLLRFRPHDRAIDNVCHDSIHEPLLEEMPRATDWSPRILGLLVFIIEIIGFAMVARNHGPYTHVWYVLGLLLVSAAIYFWLVVKRHSLFNVSDAGKYTTVTSWKGVNGFDNATRRALLMTFVFEVLLFIWALINPVGWWILGVAATLVLTIAVWIPLGGFLVALGEYWRVPVLGAALVWAFAISCWNDNHYIRTSGALPARRASANEAFDAWYARAAAMPEHANGGEIPVIVVATEGGGIRAAYWTATVLTELQDNAPAFADHTFAISAVSGGALGAEVFDALLIRRGGLSQSPVTPLKPEVRKMLNFDALSGTLAALAQPDLLQRFLPAAFLPDREQALENGWETGWHRAFGSDLFSNGFVATMQKYPGLPSLFLNGTIEETGERIITSNVDVRTFLGFRNAYDAFDELKADIPLSAASGMSARFTYVSPAGQIPYNRSDRTLKTIPKLCVTGDQPNPNYGRKFLGHVIDGGYFESSGGVTAAEIVAFLWEKKKDHPRIHPIVVDIDFWNPGGQCLDDPRPFCPAPGSCGPAAPKKSNSFAGDVLAPLWGLLNARGARGQQAVGDLAQAMRSVGGVPPAVRSDIVEFRLIPRTVPLPLGWVLSGPAMDAIDLAMTAEAGNRSGIQIVKNRLGMVPQAPASACDNAGCSEKTTPVEQKGQTQ
jgi:hypothetical protein